jgi:hypothetical protein
MRRFSYILMLLLAMVAAGCSRAGSGNQEGPLPSTPPRTSVRVENRNFLDMNVYVLEGSRRVRLGTAGGVSTTILRIPANLLFGTTSLRFQMDPIGGRATPITHEVAAQPGDEIILIIP